MFSTEDDQEKNCRRPGLKPTFFGMLTFSSNKKEKNKEHNTSGKRKYGAKNSMAKLFILISKVASQIMYSLCCSF